MMDEISGGEVGSGAMSNSKPIGRPSSYTEEKGKEICGLVVDGVPVREIGKRDDMPAVGTIYRWINDIESFRELYARAKQTQMDAFAEEILDIADNSTNDWMARNEDSEAAEARSFNGEHVQRSRLRIDSRKWLMSRLAPKKYGEKQTIEHGVDLGSSWIEELKNIK